MGSSILFPNSIVYASEAKVMDFNDINRLKYGLREINYLLDNWDEKTTYCNFGEFQNDLLIPENKLKLLKAAAETGLLDYDKSATMNVLCRKDPQVVRGFLGNIVIVAILILCICTMFIINVYNH